MTSRDVSTVHVSAVMTTDEIAVLLKLKPQTIRKHYSQHGAFMGIRPVKLPNGRLRWSGSAIARLLSGEGV